MLIPFNYYLDRHGTKGTRLDRAWGDYQNPLLTMSERQKALDFMIYTFDIKTVSMADDFLNKVLTALMTERAIVKTKNPDYVPMLRSGNYKWRTKVLPVTNISTVSSDSKMQTAFNTGNLLDVSADDKINDKAYNPCTKNQHTTYLTPRQRAKYEIDIHHGLFTHRGKPYDSSNLSAHEKTSYVAFTLNANAELSIFEHLGGARDDLGQTILHSSMNAGAPVLAAGEMEIRQGKLISINTYSGHYRPSLYSVARFLEYLCDRNVDISQTNVLLQSRPSKDLKSKQVSLSGDSVAWFQVPARNIVFNIKAIMNKNIASINSYTDSTTLFNRLFKRRARATLLTEAKMKLATDFQMEMNYILDHIQTSLSPLQTKYSLDFLDSIITRYSDELAKLTKTSTRLTNKFTKMREQIKETQTLTGECKESDETQRITNFKKHH